MLLVSALVLLPSFFDRMESTLYDMRIRLAGNIPAASDIVLLNIDDASLEELGKWPWDRGIHGQAIETLTRCDAKLIAYDIVFHGQGSKGGDARLIQAVRQGRVLLPAGFSLISEPEKIILPLNEYKVALSKSLLDSPTPSLNEISQADRAFMPLPSLADSAIGIGHISASPDEDGVLRRIPLLISLNGAPLPSIDLRTAMGIMDIKYAEWTDGQLKLSDENGREITIPLDQQGHMAVNFVGLWGHGFTSLSFHDVIAASGDEEAEADLRNIIKGKTVFIGLTSSGSTDIGPTPIASAEPLVTIHSNAVNTILQQKFIRNAPQWSVLLIAIFMVGLICLLSVRFGPRKFVIASALLIILYAAGNAVLFVTTGIMLNLSGILYLAGSTFLVTLGFKSLLLYAENEEQRIEKEKLQVQLDAAARIQSHFWPKNPDLGNGDSIYAYCSPALFVGGDFYDIIDLEDGSWMIYLADVSGKGLPAALVMASAWTQIRSHAPKYKSPDKLLCAVNNDIFPFLERDSNFVTVFILRYFPDSGLLQWVNAGHMPPLIINKDGKKEVKGKTGLPLGVMDDTKYELAETVLRTGESCIMMSDGVTEAEDSEKNLFGDERVLETLLNGDPESRGERLAKAVSNWRNGIEQNDDTTIVEVRKG
ncbi:CHASE2 domain-containing protein [Maridesulfovibrio sp.]|uniref:CHASE2 domain-containing protein n=1 Tax=Maridesulfovibrio sp. TaxID=2795000 RepID=UPI002A18908A|nr:CHASE2 domain-containing protein [Maridesulfovibrio sp.]